MHRPDDELAHIFARDMERAERGRKRLLVGGAALGAVGALAIVAALTFGAARGGTPDQQVSAEVGAAAAPSTVQATGRAQKQVESRPQAKAPSDEAKQPPAGQAAVQKVKIEIGDVGYEPSVVTVKRGVPLQLTVGKGEGCAAGFLMPELGVQADNSAGAATINLRPLKEGTYRFTCAMEMVEGRLVVE